MMPVFSLLIAATLLGIDGGYNVLILNAFFSASLAVIFRTSQLGVMTGILILLLNIATAIFLRAAAYQDVTIGNGGRDGGRRFLARAGASGLAFPSLCNARFSRVGRRTDDDHQRHRQHHLEARSGPVYRAFLRDKRAASSLCADGTYRFRLFGFQCLVRPFHHRASCTAESYMATFEGGLR